MRAEEIITLLQQWSAFTAAQLNQMHLIQDKKNSRPIYTIYKASKMFLNNLYPTWSKRIPVFPLPVSILVF